MSVTTLEQEAVPEPRRKLRWWHLIGPLLALFVVPGIVLGIVDGLKHFFPDSALIPTLLTGDLRNDSATLEVLMLISYAVMLGMMWQVAHWRGAVPLSGYFAPISARTAWLAVGVGLALVGVLEALSNFLEWTHLVTFHETQIEAMLKAHTIKQLGLTLIVAALVGPIVEEIYFRGLFLSWLRQNWSLPVAAAVNAILFALIHGNMFLDPGVQGWIATVGIAGVALVNVAWTVRTGSLWPAFITHGTFNGAQILLVSAPLIWGHG